MINRTDVGVSTDWDTDATYKRAQAALVKEIEWSGLQGDVNHYLSVFFALERVRSGGTAAAYREQLKFVVEGHTDSVGGEETNRELSEDRAGSVRKYLTNLGVPQANVARRGLGMSTPIAPNDTEAGRRQNRRVELILSGELLGDMTEETEGDSSQEPSPEEPPSEESPPGGSVISSLANVHPKVDGMSPRVSTRHARMRAPHRLTD